MLYLAGIGNVPHPAVCIYQRATWTSTSMLATHPFALSGTTNNVEPFGCHAFVKHRLELQTHPVEQQQRLDKSVVAQLFATCL
jgi:hypothetical protein